MSIGLIIFLILLGLLLFIIEFMLIPGITIAGIGGAICMVGGDSPGIYRLGQPDRVSRAGRQQHCCWRSLTVLYAEGRHMEEVHAEDDNRRKG